LNAGLDKKADMPLNATTDPRSGVLDKRLLQESVAALQARLGLPHDSAVTGEQAQAITLASGIKPEDRVLSSEILRARQQVKTQQDQ
jgi:hypothetical protein